MSPLSFVASTLLFLAQATTPSASPAPAVKTPDDPKERMQLAGKVNGLHGMDAPWHLKASYEVFGPDGKSSDKGTYEEWRVSDKQYRIALHSPSVSAEEFGTDHGVLRTGEWPRKPLSSIRELIERPVSPLGDADKATLENYERSVGAAKLSCTALLNVATKQTTQNRASFCFDSHNAVVLYAGLPNSTFQTIFQNIVLVSGHYLAKDMQRLVTGKPWLKVHVDLVEGLDKANPAPFTVPADAAPVPARLNSTGEAMAGHIVKRAFPIYPELAKQRRVEGTVVLSGVIGKDCHVTKLQVLAGPQILQAAALDAVSHWVYTPYLLDDKPVEVETDISVLFALSH